MKRTVVTIMLMLGMQNAGAAELFSDLLGKSCQVPLKCSSEEEHALIPPPLANWALPVKKTIPITSCFGPRLLMKKFTNFHEGVDFGARMRTPVSSVAEGKVIWKGSMGCAGRSVVIEHQLDGNRVALSVYKHLHSFKVVRGQKVKQGQLIALSGASGKKLSRHQKQGHRGCVAGPHLHLEFMLVNDDLDAHDIEKIINKTHGHLADSAVPADPTLFVPAVRNSCATVPEKRLALDEEQSDIQTL